MKLMFLTTWNNKNNLKSVPLFLLTLSNFQHTSVISLLISNVSEVVIVGKGEEVVIGDARLSSNCWDCGDCNCKSLGGVPDEA